MKPVNGISWVCILLLVATLCIAGCTSSMSGDKNTVLPSEPGGGKPGIPPDRDEGFTNVPPAPSVSPGESSCGFTTCHGLDLACGVNAPSVCDLSYQIGDKCRQYARCTGSGGSCTLVKDKEFDACKTCVETCEKQAVNDPAKAFECEAKC